MGCSILVRKVLRAHPAIDVVFDTTSLICLVQVWSLAMYTPRSLIYSFSFITSPFGSKYEYFSISKVVTNSMMFKLISIQAHIISGGPWVHFLIKFFLKAFRVICVTYLRCIFRVICIF